jgi:prepilin signal peptidase PulO-like enzyme (type II secretory pathway)
MSHQLAALLALVGGAAAGVVTHRLNVILTDGEVDATEPALPLEWLWAPVLDAVLLAGLFLRDGVSPRTLTGAALVLVLVQVLVFDARHRLILNRVIYPAILAALLLAPVSPLLAGTWSGRWLSAFLGALLGGGLFYVLVVVSNGGVGLGDAKLTLFIGAALGLLQPHEPTIRALIYGIILGGVVAVLLLVTRIRSLKDYIPYGPFLCLGAVAAVVFPCGPLSATC